MTKDPYLSLAKQVQRQIGALVKDIENGEGLHCLIVCGEATDHPEDPGVVAALYETQEHVRQAKAYMDIAVQRMEESRYKAGKAVKTA